LFEPVYDGITPSWEGYYKIRNNHLEGAYYGSGKEILPIKYNSVEFALSYILAMNNDGLWGMYNPEGKQILGHEWSGIRMIDGLFSLLNKGDSSYLFSIEYKKLIPVDGFLGFGGFRSDYLIFRTRSGQGILDNKCNVVIQPVFKYVYKSDNHWIVTDKFNKWGLYDSVGQPVFEPQFDFVDQLDNGVALVRTDSLWGVINTYREIVVPPKYEEIDFNNNSIKARNADTVDIYDLEDNGKLAEVNNYTNVITIRINTKTTDMSRRNRTTRKAIADANRTRDIDSIGFNTVRGWFKDSATRKWGFMSANGFLMIPPSYDQVITTDTSIYAITEINTPVTVTLFGLEVSFPSLKGLVNQYSGEIIANPEFVHIDRDIISLYHNGYWGTDYSTGIHRDGYFYKLGEEGWSKLKYDFADSEQEGFTRIYNGSVRLEKLEPKQITDEHISFHSLLDKTGGSLSDTSYSDTSYYLLMETGGWDYLNEKGRPLYQSLSYAGRFSNGNAIVKARSGNYGLLDRKGGFRISPTYSYIGYLPNSDNRQLLIKSWQPRKAFINAKGEQITGFSFQQTGEFHENRAWGLINTKTDWQPGYILIDTAGDVVSTDTFTTVHDFKRGFAAVEKNGYWGYLNTNGEKVIPLKYSKAGDFTEGLAWVSYKSKSGYIDATGKMVIPAVYNKAHDFSNGLAPVHQGGKYGFINREGKTVIPFMYKLTGLFDDNGFCTVQNKKGWGIIDTAGKQIIPFKYERLRKLEAGLYLGEKKKRYYIINPLENTTVKLGKFDKVKVDKGGKLIVTKGDRKDFINYDEIPEVASPRMLKDDKEEITITGKGKNKGAVNQFGDTIISFENNKLADLGEGFFRATRKGKTSLLDSAGALISCCFKDIKPFSDGIAPASDVNGKWGIINSNGLWILAPAYSSMDEFVNGFAGVTISEVNMVADLNGKFITEGVFETLEYIKEANMYRVTQRNKTGYVKPDGEWLWELSR